MKFAVACLIANVASIRIRGTCAEASGTCAATAPANTVANAGTCASGSCWVASLSHGTCAEASGTCAATAPANTVANAGTCASGSCWVASLSQGTCAAASGTCSATAVDGKTKNDATGCGTGKKCYA